MKIIPTFVVQKRVYIWSTLQLWWLISVASCGLLAIGLGDTPMERLLNAIGLYIFWLHAWGKGGVAFKQRDIGSLRVFFLLHPPFLLVWPTEKVRHRILGEKIAWVRYLFVEKIECEEVILKPWPLCLFVVEIPLFRFLRSL